MSTLDKQVYEILLREWAGSLHPVQLLAERQLKRIASELPLEFFSGAIFLASVWSYFPSFQLSAGAIWLTAIGCVLAAWAFLFDATDTLHRIQSAFAFIGNALLLWIA